MPKTPAVVEQPKEIEFDMEYEEKCPTCAEAGDWGVSLGFAISEGGILCFKGLHRFEALPGASEAKPGETAAPEASQEGGKITLSGFEVKTDAGGVGKVDAGKMEEIKARMAEAAQQALRDRARKPEIHSPVNLGGVLVPPGARNAREASKAVWDPRKGDVIDMPAEVRQSLGRPVEVTEARPVAGGELVVTIRLREPHAQAVTAEAEVQRQSPQDFLQNWISFALENWIK